MRETIVREKIAEKGSEMISNLLRDQRLYIEHKGQRGWDEEQLRNQQLESEASALLFIDALASEITALKAELEKYRWHSVYREWMRNTHM